MSKTYLMKTLLLSIGTFLIFVVKSKFYFLNLSFIENSISIA